MLKKMTLFVLLLLVSLLFGCSSKNSDFYDRTPGAPEKPSGESTPPEFDSPGELLGDIGKEDSALSADGEFPTDKGNNQIQPGQLTASVVFDNDEFEFWRSLQESNQEGKGIFQELYEKKAFKAYDRIKITLPKKCDGFVSLLNEKQEVIHTVKCDANGVAYLFAETKAEEYNIKITYTDELGKIQDLYDKVKEEKEYSFSALNNKKNTIELMFVIDTTGSMGDEISYLKAEINNMITKIKEENEQTLIKLALLFYRDQGDDYLTRYSDFTEDIDSQQKYLSNQFASGGGDFPEAVEYALKEASEKNWSKDNTTKILIHVADAPAHDKDIAKWNDAVKKLSSKGVKIITVASSGINKDTEYYFRCQSLITNGAYVFLTNDSGIGGDHIEATVSDKKVVEYLNKLLIRLVNGFHTGEFKEAEPYRGQK